jgi:hypothetical protein
MESVQKDVFYKQGLSVESVLLEERMKSVVKSIISLVLLCTPVSGELCVNPQDAPYNAKGDGRSAACSISASTSTLTCPSGSFSALDVGKVIAIYDVGTVTNIVGGSIKEPLSTTITGYVSSSTVTVGAVASASSTGKICCSTLEGIECIPTISCSTNTDCSSQQTASGYGNCTSGVYAVWGTNDQTAMQQAVDTLADAGGGVLAVPPGR